MLEDTCKYRLNPCEVGLLDLACPIQLSRFFHMAINWQEVITTLGGNTAALLVLAWLLRTVITEKLSRDTQTFKVGLQSSADKELEALRVHLQATANTETERFKNALQIAAEEQRIRFAKLHETRALKIADLYERLLKYSLECQRYVFQMNEEERQAVFHELERQFRDVYTFYETTRIYLPESVCVALDKLLTEMRSPAVKWWVWGAVNQYANPEQIQKRGEELLKAFEAFEKQIPAAKKVLEDEFRKMLGVEA